MSHDNTQTLWDPILGSIEHHGSVKSELCEFHPFPAKFTSQNCPNCCRTVLQGPQNCFKGVPARKKVLGGLLKCPKTPHYHYGTLPWGPQGTLSPAKSNFLNFHRFPAKFALQSCQNLHGTILCDPKTRLRGSLRATKCLDASYSVPRRHTITMGPSLGPAKSKKNAHFTHPGVPEKNTGQKAPQEAKTQKKIEIPQKMRPFHQNFLLTNIWPIYSG